MDMSSVREAELAPVQVLFYDPAAADFAFAWQAAAPARRWLFQVAAAGPPFLYYLCLRLQQLGQPPAQVLIAAAGEGAIFSAGATVASPNSPAAVGLLPLATSPADFGSTLAQFAPGATLTLLTSATAGNQVFEGSEYRGVDLVGSLAGYLGGWVSASDQAITWNGDGSASTAGNIWLGDPASGEAVILGPAPAGGQQSFPLDPHPANG